MFIVKWRKWGYDRTQTWDWREEHEEFRDMTSSLRRIEKLYRSPDVDEVTLVATDGDVVACPFGEWFDVRPEDRCPVCGDRGDFVSVTTMPSRCVS